MEKISECSWEEVFANWKEREGQDQKWQKVATEVKGWPDWESWRRNSAEMLKADRRQWSLYRFGNPLGEIPEMLVAIYRLAVTPSQYQQFQLCRAAASAGAI